MKQKVIDHYLYDEAVFDTHDEAYVALKMPDVPLKPLTIPPLLAPDQERDGQAYYTVTAMSGESDIFPEAKTKTWGYNGYLLGPTIVFKQGVTYHITLQNQLPEVTTFHWHGLNVDGPITDGGPHAPVDPGGSREIHFCLTQPAMTGWMHPHPCPYTAEQVWKGLALMTIVQDDTERALPFPRNYGVDDIPLILQDRRYHDYQLDYQKDYDADGTQGDVPLVNGTVNGYVDITTQRVRLRILNGANRKEFRLHFTDELPFLQIASDGGILPEPVAFSRLMLTAAERVELLVDFKDYHAGDEVVLYSDDCALVTFRIQAYEPDPTLLPEKLVDIPQQVVTPELPIKKTVMSGMDQEVRLDGKLFDMQRIDARQQIELVQLWDVTNTNDMTGGMIHPFHIHGTQFQIVSRNGQPPHPNETGWKDTFGVNAGETVRISVRFEQLGVYMYHCHILEHEDTGMMAQIEVFDPKHPVTYHLMSMADMKMKMTKEQAAE